MNPLDNSGINLQLNLFYQVSAMHLLSASMMSAPAALAMSKIMYPELSRPIITNKYINSIQDM